VLKVKECYFVFISPNDKRDLFPNGRATSLHLMLDGLVSEGLLRRHPKNGRVVSSGESRRGVSFLLLDPLFPLQPLLVDHHPGGLGKVARLEGMKNPLTQEGEARSPIHLPFDELDFRHQSFHHSVVDPPG